MAITKKIREKVIERSKSGENVAALAAKYGVNRGTVYEWIRKSKSLKRKYTQKKVYKRKVKTSNTEVYRDIINFLLDKLLVVKDK